MVNEDADGAIPFVIGDYQSEVTPVGKTVVGPVRKPWLGEQAVRYGGGAGDVMDRRWGLPVGVNPQADRAADHQCGRGRTNDGQSAYTITSRHNLLRSLTFAGGMESQTQTPTRLPTGDTPLQTVTVFSAK